MRMVALAQTRGGVRALEAQTWSLVQTAALQGADVVVEQAPAASRRVDEDARPTAVPSWQHNYGVVETSITSRTVFGSWRVRETALA